MALLEVQAVEVAYGESVALDGLSLELHDGQLMAVLGPSGSGKTTLLNAVAGFVEVRAGEIRLRGDVVSRAGRTRPPEQRRVGLVFQSYALWPHMSVLDTVVYPFRRRGIGERAAREQARQLLARVGLTELESRRPDQLSGGQQQRVGLVRALAVEPDLFLFDEPTANLDPSLRATLQAELRQSQQAAGAAGLYVTHDPTEALAIADMVAVLRSGRLVQLDVPERVYQCPADEWVAILTGAATILDGEIIGPAAVALTGVPRLQCAVHTLSPFQTGPRRLCVRPEWVSIADEREANGFVPGWPARVVGVRFQGPHTDYQLATQAGPILARRAGGPRHAPGVEVRWTLTAVAAV